MKNNILKYIFAIFVIALIGFAVYKIYQDEKANNENTQPTTDVKQESTIATDLRLAIAGFDNMNPILSKNKNVQDITKLVFEPLLTLDENYKLQPCLAKEWSKTGDTSYVLKLRTDVKWQSGLEFTAEDVHFTIDLLKNIPSIYSYNVQHVVYVEVIDNNTIKIDVDTPIPYFEYNLTFPIMSKQFYLGQDFTTSTGNNTPVATGMFKISANDGKMITLKKNQNWWNQNEKSPKIDTITINLYESMGEVYKAFKMGNIDLITTESLNYETHVGTIGYQKKEIKGREFDFIAFNCNNSLLTRTEIRKAISYAIDRNGIISNVYQGKYEGINFPLDYGTWAYSEEQVSSGYNPEQAKQVLLDSGWEYKNKSWQKIENYRTVRLTVNLLVNADDTDRVAASEIIKQNLEAIGIGIKINSVSSKRFEEYLANKNYDMVLIGTNTSMSPELTTYFGTNNLANYQKEEITSIMGNLPNITDENLVKEQIKRIAEISKEEVPYISLYLNKKIIIYSTTLIGDVVANNYNLFYHFENWYRQY